MQLFDRIVLDIAAIIFSLFFVFATGLIIYVWITYRRLVKRATMAIDSVESVSRMIKEVGSKSSLKTVAKILKYIFMSSRKN